MGVTFNSFGFNGGGTGGGGSPGPPGTPGSVWRNGTNPPDPSLGINGDYYLQNSTGIVFTKVAGVYQPIANIDGTDGTDGSVWYNGSGAPSPSPSFNPNDYYLDTSNGDVYTYNGSSWGTQIANIDGADGTNGTVWYANNGFPPPAGTYIVGDFYLNNDDGEVYQYDGTNWISQINIKGASGTQWFTGATPPSALQSNGDFYLDGSTGDVYEQIANVWTATGTNIKGANGTNGTDGSVWYSGATVPPTITGYNISDYFLETTTGNVYQNNGVIWDFQLTLSGVAGSSWFNGNGAPTVIENDGDYYLDDLTGDVYTQVSGAWALTGNIKGPAGAAGADGQDGSSSSYFFYRTKTTIISGDPLSLHIRWNNVTPQISATELGISKETEDGVDISIFLALLQVGDTIVIQDKDVAANFQTWEVSGAITDNPTWVSVPVTFVTSGGTGTSNFANNLEVIVAISREGTAGADGANSTRYGFDSTTTAPTAPTANRFATDNTDLTLVTAFSADQLNQNGLNFTDWWTLLENWYNTKGLANNLLQIREVGNDSNVFGSYNIIQVKWFGTYVTLDLLFLAGQGTLDPTKTYVISYALVGAEGSANQGISAANNVQWIYDTVSPPLGAYFAYQGTGGLASQITSFELNDTSTTGNQFDWLEYARTTSLTGSVGILSVCDITSPTTQSNFTISSITDDGGYHTFNVSFLGGADFDFNTLTASASTVSFAYVFNGVGGGGTIGVYYPDISSPIDLATNTMVFTGGGVTVTQISASDVEINIPSGGSDGSIVASIRSLSTSTTLSPFTVGALTIPYNGNITGWTIFSDVSGSCTVDFLSGSYASYPPTTSIFSGNAPNLASNVKNELLSLSIGVTQGDVLLCNLVSISGTMSRIDVTLLITKS
jgi:hypothetical protein